MKIIWLGQASLYFETENVSILIDPYFSNSVEKFEKENYRRIPINKDLFDLKPDILIFTHDHLDHYDPETAPIFLQKDYYKTVLCPKSVFGHISGFSNVNNVKCISGTVWTYKDIRIEAIKADHSDEDALGFIITDLNENKNYYVTGDTLYNVNIVKEAKEKNIYMVFVPINGKGNNMNYIDAMNFAKDINAKYSVPVHFGMFDNIDPNIFNLENRIIPSLYKEIQ